MSKRRPIQEEDVPLYEGSNNDDLNCFYEELPREIQYNIIFFLDEHSCLQFAQTSKSNHDYTLEFAHFNDCNFFKYISKSPENVHLLGLILHNPNFDPCFSNNFVFRWASENGHDKVVALFLKDKRVDPSVIDNYALRFASRNGYDKVVELLLEDERVDPSARDDYALKFSSWNGHGKVVGLLLNDERIDPSAQDYYATRFISKYGNGCAKLFELMLLNGDDRRIENFLRKNFN